MIELIKFKKILFEGLWEQENIDLAGFLQGLLSEAKELTVLEGVSVFYRFNP